MNTAWSKPTKYVVGIGLALVGVYILYLAHSFIPILVLAALIAMVVRPIVVWLQTRARLPRRLAVALVYVGLLILIPLALALIIPTIVDAVSYVLSIDYQAVLQTILKWLGSSLEALKTVQLPVAALDTYVERLADALLTALQEAAAATTAEPPSVAKILDSLRSVLSRTFDVAAGVVSQTGLLIFSFLVSIYISLSAHTFQEALLGAVPPAYRPEVTVLLARVGAVWSGFFRGELTLMLVVGVLSWFGLTMLGVPGAVYLGTIAGLLEIIPTLGPIVATVPAVIVALLQGSTRLNVSPLLMGVLVIGFYILVQQLENNLIVPRVLGNAVALPPLIVILGVAIGASIGGVLGALLATPVIATGREILIYCYRKLLGQEPFPQASAAADLTGLGDL